jgi:hypothetical protein
MRERNAANAYRQNPLMAGYKAPRARLHRDFLYLDHDTIINSLSAIEAGKIDEIIQKVNEAREGGFEGSVGAGPLKGGGGKKRAAKIEEELVKTRTWFSAFDAWHRHLVDHDAIGTFDVWDLDVREALTIGDTLEFLADVVLSPVHKLFRTFLSYADSAGKPGSQFHQRGAELAETKASARAMTEWMGGRDKPTHLPTYLLPGGIAEPRIVARLKDEYITGDRAQVESTYTVVGQVAALLANDQVESIIRVIRDVPPTPREVETISDAMTHFIDAGRELGVEFDSTDITIPAPAVIVRPIAIFQ